MTDHAPKQQAEDLSDGAPANDHRCSSTPTQSTSSRQCSQPKAESPGGNKKRKRDTSEASQGAAVPSDAIASQQPTLSSTAAASADHPELPVLSVPQTSSSSMGRSVSMTSIAPGNGQMQVDLSVKNGKEDHTDAAAADDSAVVLRSKEKLAACLACDLCHEVLKDPVTAPECMHSFCRDCIDQHVLYGGTKNICPVCKATDLETVLGPQPFQHGKLQFDPMLADMIRKLFPRAEVEKGIQERQDAEAKFRASLMPLKKPKLGHVKTPPPSTSAHASAPSGSGLPVLGTSQQPAFNLARTQAGPAASARVGVFLQTSESHMQLALPYLWVQQGMPLKSLCSYVSSQLHLDSSMYQLSLECEGTSLQSAVTVQSVWQQWLRTHPVQDLVVIQVRIQHRTAPSSHPTK